jgi:hypothetical protein
VHLNVKRLDACQKRCSSLIEDNEPLILESSLTDLRIESTTRETHEGVRMQNIMAHARETIHAVAVTTMLVIAELHAQQARCVQSIMEIQDQLHAETTLIGAALDQIAGRERVQGKTVSH